MNTSVSFFTPVQEDIREVEALMRAQADEYHPDLGSALNVILSSGGKRVRPSITLLVGQLLGAPRKPLLSLAAAVELLHTATLVHDDLIDSSMLRRGSPTLNSFWSAGATVLTGDFLFACAAKLASDTNSLPVVQQFSKVLTTIVNGEITQLFTSPCRVSREDYYQRIYAKTASLFETAAKTPALLCPSCQDIVESMCRYGYEIGMAFQIVDDVLDFTSQPDELGKPVGSDLRQGLVTLPVLYYLEDYPKDQDVRSFVQGKCQHDDELTQRLIDSIGGSEAIDQSLEEANQHVEKALHYLRVLPAGIQRDSLESLAEYIVHRNL